MATKADDNGPFKEFDFEEWLREGVEGVRGRFKSKKTHFDTSGFETHMRNACKEHLMAMRSLVDSFIDIVEEKEEAKTKKV